MSHLRLITQGYLPLKIKDGRLTYDVPRKIGFAASFVEPWDVDSIVTKKCWGLNDDIINSDEKESKTHPSVSKNGKSQK
jgi:hypothetical protein